MSYEQAFQGIKRDMVKVLRVDLEDRSPIESTRKPFPNTTKHFV